MDKRNTNSFDLPLTEIYWPNGEMYPVAYNLKRSHSEPSSELLYFQIDMLPCQSMQRQSIKPEIQNPLKLYPCISPHKIHALCIHSSCAAALFQE